MTGKQSGPPGYTMFGGSFDPPHRGHRQIIEALVNSGRNVLVVPAQISPFKTDRPPVLPEHRLAMTRLMVEAIDPALREKVSVSKVEIDRKTVSYTAETIRLLEHTDTQVRSLCLGEDSLKDFCLWKDYEWLLANLELVILRRRGTGSAAYTYEQFEKDYGSFSLNCRLIPVSIDGCSSTEIRRELVQGQQSDCLDRDVYEYAIRHELY